MAYVRKTIDEFDIEANYGQGWEIVNCEATWKAAKRSIMEYRTNQPGNYRIKKHRVKLQTWEYKTPPKVD